VLNGLLCAYVPLRNYLLTHSYAVRTFRNSKLVSLWTSDLSDVGLSPQLSSKYAVIVRCRQFILPVFCCIFVSCDRALGLFLANVSVRSGFCVCAIVVRYFCRLWIFTVIFTIELVVKTAADSLFYHYWWKVIPCTSASMIQICLNQWFMYVT